MNIEVSIMKNKKLVYSFNYIAKKSDSDAHERATELAVRQANFHGLKYDYIKTKLIEE